MRLVPSETLWIPLLRSTRRRGPVCSVKQGAPLPPILPGSRSHLQLILDIGWKRLTDIEQMGDGPGTHLLHHVAPMELHSDFADTKIERDLLVHRTGDDKPQNLPLAGRKCLIQGRVLSGYGRSRPASDVGRDGCR